MRFLHFFPLTLLCVALIFVLSFFTPPSTPLSEVAYIDKWTHLVMYGGTVGMFWIEYLRANLRGNLRLSGVQLWLVTLIGPVLLGGLIELLQAYCTGGRRSGEWLDWVADSMGVVLACVAGCLMKRVARRKSTDSSRDADDD